MAKSCSLGSGHSSDMKILSVGVTWIVSVENPAVPLAESVGYKKIKMATRELERFDEFYLLYIIRQI